MVRFYKEYKKVPPSVAQIPWAHNIILIEKIKDMYLRYWYIEKTVANGDVIKDEFRKCVKFCKECK